MGDVVGVSERAGVVPFVTDNALWVYTGPRNVGVAWWLDMRIPVFG